MLAGTLVVILRLASELAQTLLAKTLAKQALRLLLGNFS